MIYKPKKRFYYGNKDRLPNSILLRILRKNNTTAYGSLSDKSLEMFFTNI
jgi:hypothetical protein